MGEDEKPFGPTFGEDMDKETIRASARDGKSARADEERSEALPMPFGAPDDDLPLIPGITILKTVGKGGMGTVYLGRQDYLDRHVAVKVLAKHGAFKAAEFLERFRREARLLAQLAHPNVVACHQAGVTETGHAFLVMEFIEGPTLREFVETNGGLAEIDALEMAIGVSQALDYAQSKSVIHRDIKPENILLQPLKDAPAGMRYPFIVKLADLGIARNFGESAEERLTMDGIVLGTPTWAAPEQLSEPEKVDHRADIYGVGSVLYHSLTGRLPFEQRTFAMLYQAKVAGEPPDPSTYRKDLRPEVVQLVRSLLAADRERRPQSHAEVVTLCKRLVPGSSGVLKAYRVKIPESRTDIPGVRVGIRSEELKAPSRQAARKPKSALVAGIGAAVVLLGAMTLLRSRGQPAPSVSPADQGSGQPAPIEKTWTTLTKSVEDVSSLSFGSGKAPLIDADQRIRMDPWEKTGRSALFGPVLDGAGISGSGTGRLSRDLPTLPVLIDATFAPNDGESGLRLELSQGTGIACLAQNLGKSVALSLVLIRPGEGGLEDRGVPTEPVLLDRLEKLHVHLVVTPTLLRAEAEGKLVGQVALREKPVRLSLYVNGTPALFEELTARAAAK